jgi:hypothetical protein
MSWGAIAAGMTNYGAGSGGGSSGGSWMDWFGGSGSGGGGTDWYGAILSGLSSYSEGRQRGKDVDRQGEWTIRGVQEGGRQSRLNSQYEASLADHYRRLQQQERRQGFSNFGRYARNQYEAPTYTPPPVGAAPTAMAFEEEWQAAAPKPKTAGGLAGAARR